MKTAIGAALATLLVGLTLIGLAWCVGLKIEYQAARVVPAVGSTDAEIADWTFGLLLTSIISVFVTISGLYWVAQSLAATNRANELSSKSLEVSERAWIFTTPRALGPKKFYNTGNWDLEVAFDNVNSGKTVAFDVHTSCKATWYGNQNRALKKLVDETDRFADSGIMMVPGQVFERPWGLTSDQDPPQTAEELAVAGTTAMLVGVISYRTIFDNVIHRTAFVYAIGVGDGGQVEFKPWAGGFAT